MIKIGYLVSYDYRLFFNSVKLVYSEATKIYIAIDKNCLTWNGNLFKIPNSFYEEVKRIDHKNKIEFYFDNFFVPELTPIQCETRERNLLLKRMGKGWLIQLDVDEYLYDFKVISNYLKKHWFLTVFPKLTPIILKGKLVTLFRQLPSGFLYIENNERFSFITNQTKYMHTRSNNNIRNHYTNINVIHQSWARSNIEISTKINNWGHVNDFDTDEYFKFWESLNLDNYKNYKNIHPLQPTIWNELKFLKAKTSDEFIENYSKNNEQLTYDISKIKILKSLIKKIIGRE